MAEIVKEEFDFIDQHVTAENARDLAETDEKFTFVLDLLNLSASHPEADALVDELQDKLESLQEKLEK